MRALLLAPVLLVCCGDSGPARDPTTGGETTATAGGAPTSGSGDGVDPGTSPRIERATPISTPGSSVFVQTDLPISEVELRIDDLPLEDVILYGGGAGGEYGALLRLPAQIGAGISTIGARRRGAAADSDSARVEIVAPIFVDVADRIGLTQVHDVGGHPKECAWSSTGLAFADIDEDGDSDFYVGNVGAPGRLFRNDGDATGDGLPDFTPITPGSGLGLVDNVSSASFMDYDNDGDRDLFIGRRGANVLMRNQLVETGAATFVDVTAASGLGAEVQRTMGVAWGDHDGDGDLDLYVINHAICFPYKGSALDSQDHFYRNDSGVFVEITDQLGLDAGSPVHALGFSGAFVDHDRDGDQDLIVINDHIAGMSGPNALWRNDGPGAAPGEWRFTDVAAEAGLAIAVDANGDGANAMGLAIGDVDHDGLPDVAFSNIGPNYLLRSRGDGTYEDISDTGARRGLLAWQSRSITWGVHLLDVDNDADLDLYFAGGTIHDSKRIPDALLRNDGGGFVEVTWAAGLTDIGSAKASALVDLDRDGSLEFATAHWADRLRVYHNERPGPAHHWLAVELVGTSSNRDALGSVVELETAAGPRQTCFRTPNPSLGAGGELTCHFGLGEAAAISRLTVTWPNGQVTQIPPPAVDQRVTYVQ